MTEASIADIATRLTKEVPDLLAEHHLPGLAVGICDRSGARWSAGFGVRARGSDDRVSTHTTFSIQSTSKLYTATAVMLAVQQGIVELDVPVTTYLPDFTVNSRWEQAPERRMTLRHLLSHTAGFTHEAPLGGNFDDRDTSFDEHCRSISETWLRFPVGHHYEYSNLGIDLAGYVLERLTGVDFAGYVRRELLEPLGLHRTTFDDKAIAADSDRAIGHSDLSADIPVRVPMVAAGGAYTCVDDALGFLRFHLGGGLGLLRSDLLDHMYDVHNPLPGQTCGYGLGVAIARWNGKRVLNHGGGGFGFLCDFAWDPTAGVGVVVLTNSDDNPLKGQLASDVLRNLTGSDDTRPNVPPAVQLDDAAMTRMVGEYVGSNGTLARISFEGSRLTLERSGTTQPLRPIGPDEIVVEDDGYQRFKLTEVEDTADAAYLISVDDSSTYYRNDAPDLADDAAVESYAVDIWGTQAVTLRVRRHGSAATLEYEAGSMRVPPLRLTEYRPGLSFCSTGEALDLTTARPTYANIPLRPEPPTDGERSA